MEVKELIPCVRYVHLQFFSSPVTCTMSAIGDVEPLT